MACRPVGRPWLFRGLQPAFDRHPSLVDHCRGARALSRLAQFRGPRLLAHAARLLGEREGAYDMVQEAWIGVLRGIGRFEASATPP